MDQLTRLVGRWSHAQRPQYLRIKQPDRHSRPRPRPRCPRARRTLSREQGRQRDRAARLGDDPQMRGRRRRIAAATSASLTASAARPGRRAARRRSAARPAWSAARRSGSAAPARRPARSAPPASERAMSSQPSGSTDDDLASPASAKRDPGGEAAAAARHDHHRRRRAPSCAAISTPTLPCPSITSTSSNEGTRVAPRLGGQPRADRLAALGGAVVEDDLGAGGASRLDLHRRRVGGHDDGRRDAEPRAPRAPRPGHGCRRRKRPRRAPARPRSAASAGWSRRAA